MTHFIAIKKKEKKIEKSLHNLNVSILKATKISKFEQDAPNFWLNF